MFLINCFTEDPKEFLIGFLDQLKESRDNRVDGPCLFNESNLDSVFGLIDPTNEGYVTYAQYKEGEQRYTNIYVRVSYTYIFII